MTGSIYFENNKALFGNVKNTLYLTLSTKSRINCQLYNSSLSDSPTR